MTTQQPEMLETATSNALFLPQHFEKQMIALAEGALGIFTVMPEMLLHPRFGTRVIHPLSYGAGFIVWQTACLLGFFYGQGRFGPWTLYLLWAGLSLYHLVRLAPKFRDQRLEKDSELPGKPWGIFRHLPHATHVTIGCLYEPAALLIITTILALLRLIPAPPAVLLMVGAFSLSLRTGLINYEGWLYRRIMADNQYRASVLDAQTNTEHRPVPTVTVSRPVQA